MPTTTTQAVSPGYIYTVTASSEAIVRDVETDKLLCKANNGSQGMFVAIGGTVSMSTDDATATITQASTTSGGARFEVHQTRPNIGEEGVIYLIPITSSTDEDNEYEEWIWVKGEWERLGTTGVNLSNYATLTDANTYSGDNTFNGLLLKKNSASLGDTSVLNRSEADARYGRLEADNTWSGDQTIAAGHTLMIPPSATLITNSIQGNNGSNNQLNFNSLHLVNIGNAGASYIRATTVNTNTLLTDTITAINRANKIEFKEVSELQFPSSGGILSGVKQLKYKDATIGIGDSDSNTVEIRTNLRFPVSESRIELRQGIISGVASLSNGDTNLYLDTTQAKLNRQLLIENDNGLFASYVSKVKTLRNNDVIISCNNSSIPNGANAVLVQASEGIKVAPANSQTPTVTIAPTKIEAFQLSADVFGQDKWGLRLTPDSCQLFGINFNYGDVWSETNDRIKAQDATPMPGLDSASYLDTVKIRKPAVSIETTGIGSLSFDYANEAYIRTFPNDGGQGIFEFQVGNWTDANADHIKRGPVDLRKASATTLGPNSVLNMEEGDARWGGAQPYAYYNASVMANIPALEPNSITHIGAYSDGASVDLSGITLAQYTDSVTTAELWLEVTSSGTTIIWPDGMLWPDETDPTVAPSFSGPEASTEVGYITQRLYCVTLRTQHRRNLSDSTFSSVLIASIAYIVDSKLPYTAGGGGD